MNLLTKLKKIFAKKKTVPAGIQNRRFEIIFPDLYLAAIRLQYAAWRYGHLTHDETLVQIAALARYLKPKKVFEFGTFDGRTTLNIALNLEEGGTVYSLDLPEQDLSESVEEKEKLYMQQKLRRCLFRENKIPENVLKKTVLLEGDSNLFDFNPFHSDVDLVLVDGGHDRKTIISDSCNAFQMLKPRGTIIWDDYCDYWPDVVRVLDRLSLLLPLFRDERTGLVLYRAEQKAPISPEKIRAFLIKE